MIPILVPPTMRAAVVVVAISSVLPSMLLVVFPGGIDNAYNDSGNIIVVGDLGSIICGIGEMMITI